MKALIDADIIVMRFALANQHTVIEYDDETGEKIERLEANFKKACKDADRFIKKVLRTTWSDDYILCFSDSKENNFRYKVLPSYKHNRKNLKKPIIREKLAEYLKAKHTYVLKRNLEADDALGLLQSNAKENESTIICTVDKDLDQIEGLHYNWNSGETYEVSEIESKYMFYLQILIGDSTDGYKGCKGIGKVLARKHLPHGKEILDEYEVWSRIVALYELKGQSEEDAITQARVARMLRGDEYNNETGEVNLWEPLTNNIPRGDNDETWVKEN